MVDDGGVSIYFGLQTGFWGLCRYFLGFVDWLIVTGICDCFYLGCMLPF